APDHQIAIYTHTDKDHIHNHIVINSVNLETGKK
ncbi:relaxase/mobilization nuclease domain-containing protein, partial [Enterococcus faecium]